MNHLLLHLFVRAISSFIRGRSIGEVRYLAPIVSIELAGKRDTRSFVIILSNPGPFCYLAGEDPLCGVGAAVFKRIRGARIVECEQVDDDRLIRLCIQGTRDTVDLVIRLFGSVAKVRLLGEDTIIESLDIRESGRACPTRPKTERPSIAAIDAESLTRFWDSADPPERTVPGLTRELVEGFRGATGELDHTGLLAFRDDLVGGNRPFHLGTRGRLGAAGPLPDPMPGPSGAATMPLWMGPYERADLACADLGQTILDTVENMAIHRHAGPLVKHLEGRRRLAAKLEAALDESRGFERWRNEANILAAFQSKIPPGAHVVELPDLYGSGETTTIKLDPATPIRDQIDKRFRRATKLERGRGAIETRLRAINKEIGVLETEFIDIGELSTLADAIRRVDDAMRRFRLVPKIQSGAGPRQGARTHRRFDLDPMWFALVGRNDRENDELTFRTASPDDVWFHAHQVAGSHVILRSHGAPGNPPGNVLESAAEIAAYFSKGRHASLVPVIYTLKKYVRKFKGARPGQVVCEREKTILARPRLPEQADTGKS